MFQVKKAQNLEMLLNDQNKIIMYNEITVNIQMVTERHLIVLLIMKEVKIMVVLNSINRLIKMDKILLILGNSIINVEGNSNIGIKGNSEVDIEGNADINVTGNADIQTDKADIKSSDISIECDNLDIKATKTSITSDVDIKGATEITGATSIKGATEITGNCDVSGTLSGATIEAGNGSSGTYTTSVIASNGIVTGGS